MARKALAVTVALAAMITMGWWSAPQIRAAWAAGQRARVAATTTAAPWAPGGTDPILRALARAGQRGPRRKRLAPCPGQAVALRALADLAILLILAEQGAADPAPRAAWPAGPGKIRGACPGPGRAGGHA